MRKIFILILLFISSCLFAQTEDCNQDSTCVIKILTSMPDGWKFVESKGLAWPSSCPETTDFYFEFKNSRELNIFEKTVNCKNKVTKSRQVYQTNYKIIKINSFNQIGIRIYKFNSNMRSLLDSGIAKEKIKDFADFQFLFTEQKHQLKLRANTELKQSKSIENTFE
jgi:hypothetical protein